MPDFPPELIALAADAMPGLTREHAIQVAAEVLEAVAVPLGEHAASKILAHMEAHVANPATTKFPRAQATRQHSARRHFQTAARVAASAFLTEDDTKRLAAEAITRGDYMTCPALEDEQ